MSEKNKSTPKAKVLTAVLLVLFFGSCAVLVFAVCTDILGIAPKNPNPTEPQVTTAVSVTESATVETTEASEPSSSASAPQSSTAVSSQLTLGSTYNVDYWVEYMDNYGASGLAVLFGARTKGATVTFTEENTFTVTVESANGSVEVSAGTYSFLDDSNIELRFDNSNITVATVIETGDNEITSLDFPMDVDGTTLRLSLAD